MNIAGKLYITTKKEEKVKYRRLADSYSVSEKTQFKPPDSSLTE